MQDRGRTRLWARTLAVFLAASATVVLAAVDVMDLPPSHINQCPDAYLFEFKSEPGGTGASQEVETFMAKLAVMKSVRVRHEFGTLLNGVSAHVKNPDELREIMGWDIVDNVTPLTIVSPPEQVQPMQNALVTSALNMTGASRVHSELGLKGEGIKVGVIDTGIDYSHPALGGCFGKGCKVAYGYDLVGDKFSGQNTPVPSGNPMDCAGHGTHVAGIVCASDAAVTGVAPEVTLGAYRVLGCEGSTNNDVIIAALERASKDKMDVINLSLGEPNGWTNNPVSRAIAKARSRGILVAAAQGNENTYGLFGTNYVAEGASVLSVASLINTRMALSAFTTSLDPSHPIYYTKKDIGLNGTFLILALLNGTELGTGCEPYQTDLTGKVVIVLRGSCLFSIKAQNALDNHAAGILFVNNMPGSLEVDVGSAKLLSGSISQKAGQKLFELLKSNTKTTGSNITADATATFPEKQDVLVNESGGSASTFSSYGLDNELHLKPDIAAPGENIYSTWLTKNGSYTTLSGTSMASPHVAGALALALQRYRALTGITGPTSWPHIQRIYQIFKNTAEPSHVYDNHIPFDGFFSENSPPIDSNTAVESVTKQGSGMINIYRAVTSIGYGFKSIVKEHGNFPPIRSTFVSPSVLELNDTHLASQKPQMITLYNYGSETIQYELSHLPAETVHELSIETREVKIKNRAQYKVKSSDKDLDDVMFVKADAEVEFPSRVVSVPAGGQRRVAVKISPPKDLSADQHWVYSGFIVIRALSSPSTTVSGDNNTASPSEAIHVPYAGVKGKMRSLPIFLRPTEEELQVNNQTVYCQVLGSSLANKTEYIYSFEGMDVPILSYCIANPTKFLIIDLISGGEDSQSSNAPQVGDYQVLGRVGFEELLPRSPPQTIVSAIQWDGTIEIGEGSNSETPRTVGSREIVHHEPGMDLLYRMRPKAEGYDRSGASYTDSHFEKIVQRDIEEENTEKGKGKGYGDDMANKKEASPKSKKKALKQHLFRGHKKTEGEESVQVPDGRYRLRLRALRMLGDIDNSDDYDVWITPTFTIQRADPAPGTASNGTTTSAGPASTAATLPSASKAPTP